MSSHPDSDSPDLPPSLQEQLAEALQPVEPGAEQRERLRSRILARVHEQVPDETRTVRAADGRGWIEIVPHVQVKELYRDEAAGTHLTLMRMQPGGVVPAHRHSKEEQFIVLEGECQFGTHRLSAGDVHIAAPGSWHEAVSTDKGVLVLLRGEYPHPLPASAR